jgi:ABC-type glycerol-3-phosphate transport system substrate-binding protein
LDKKTIAIVIAAVVVAAAIAVALSSVLFSGPKVPNVKFVTFNTEGKQTLKENQQKVIAFNDDRIPVVSGRASS